MPTDRYPTTEPETVRRALRLSKRVKPYYTVRPGAAVVPTYAAAFENGGCVRRFLGLPARVDAFRTAVLTLLCIMAVQATAAPLDTTPATLIERANLVRDARDLPWDPDAGRLGNLRRVHIVAPDCTLRVVSGPENRLYQGRSAVWVQQDSSDPGPAKSPRPLPRNVTIKLGGHASPPRVDPLPGTACFTLQLATAHELTLHGDRMAVLFDRVELPALRIHLNPSYAMRLWFHEARLGLLSLHSNASATAGGTGQIEWLQLSSSQGSTALLFHDMNARHIGVTATTTGARFSVRIGPETDAGYHQPARAPGALANLYPIWIDGPVAALQIPAGRVKAMPLTAALREETRALRESVMDGAGPAPVLPAVDPALSRSLPNGREPLSPGQRVADVLEPLLLPGITIGKVDLWKNGGALEGRAPDEAAVREWVGRLNRSGEVRNAQVGVIRGNAGSGRVAYRVLVDFMCAAPGEPSVCLPGKGNAYTAPQIEEAIKPMLGSEVTLTALKLRKDGMVELEGRASASEASAAVERVRAQAAWLQASTSSIGSKDFWARFRMVCNVPPRAAGICATESQPR